MNQTVESPSPASADTRQAPVRGAATALPRPAGPPPRVAVVSASWHHEIVHRARDALVDELGRLGVNATQVDHYDVPGAFEIPLHARRLARTGRYDAIVACGLVVDGGIYRHDFVGRAVIDGLMRVQLDCDVPVLSVVLTPHHFHDTEEHRGFFARHFVTKGVEAAHACLGAIGGLRSLGFMQRA